jgi:galactose mutarotase-like enzyme
MTMNPVDHSSITSKPFGTTTDGQRVTQYTLTNAHGACVSIINYGGTANYTLTNKNELKLVCRAKTDKRQS